MVDVNAIGAGGGSIAWIERRGGLRVGPHSAGSEPGPACYGRGGEEATVTDASVVLGYIDPAYFAGGTLKLEPELARASDRELDRAPAGMSRRGGGARHPPRAQRADGRGHPPGLDPPGHRSARLHAAAARRRRRAARRALADELGITSIVVPRHPGVLSAAGLLAARIEHEMSGRFPRPIVAATVVPRCADARRSSTSGCAELMRAEGVGDAAHRRRLLLRRCLLHRPVALSRDPVAPR